MSDEDAVRDVASHTAASCLALHARLLSRILTDRYEAAVSPFGLSIVRFLLLGAVAAHGRVSPSKLAEELSFDPSTLSRNFKALRAEGLIHMEHSTEGGYVEISVTSRGEELFLKAREGWAAAQQEAEAALGPQLSEAIKDAARKVAE
jgi:DNA-binding MarR family transcriptional regulator